MAEEDDPLATKIKQLLKVTAGDGNDGVAEMRERQDRQRLQELSIQSRLKDTLVTWQSKEFLVASQQLLATGSSWFKAQLSPDAQAQTKRRFDHVFKSHPLIKYVLDLTPPIEGDDSAYLVAQLSLSDGVRDWWRSYCNSPVSKSLVFGHDDVCPGHFDLVLSGAEGCERDTYGRPPIYASELEYPIPRKIADYCPIRHRAAILRLLMAIDHEDLVLNSAPRTVNMVVIAKYFDCVQVVRDSVLTWFTTNPNQNFIQVNTEDALWMSWILELRDVARVAFRLLVVERTIEMSCRSRAGSTKKPERSVLGRRYGRVTDEQETCIQHAAQKLAQRAEDLWAGLISDDVNTYLGITQWPTSNPYLCRILLRYIHRIVKNALMIDSERDCITKKYDFERARYVPTAGFVSTKDVCSTLSGPQQILTCDFWRRFGELASFPEGLDEHVVDESVLVYPPPNDTGLGAGSSLIKFDRSTFHAEFLAAVLDLHDKWACCELEIQVPVQSLCILSLSDEEFKFLPLWAGGLDDGTGRVYQSEIPDADRGVPIGPGPAFYTGETIHEGDGSTITDDEQAATVFTGTDTVSMTSGRSIKPARSQTTSVGGELLVTAMHALSTAARNPQEEPIVSRTTQATRSPYGGFGWTPGGSENQSDFGDFSDSSNSTSRRPMISHNGFDFTTDDSADRNSGVASEGGSDGGAGGAVNIGDGNNTNGGQSSS
ncbi:hypothetical protein NUW58_g3618 [Xylaria curta]|uniref:Uncharacterized protein n=1 Tax=Xylaria curta TaxID=42375 RepID=A0ACC1PCG3_9PEZI|nr:hypothetical protein NUW58_g3618 [Xylaria curta]